MFFSATLLPVHYYKRLLSTEKDNYAVMQSLPFDQRRDCFFLNRCEYKVYKKGEDTYRRYAQYLYQTALANEGIILHFPILSFYGRCT